MSGPLILTVQDCFDYAIAYEQGHSISADRAILATVLHSAYMELGQEFDWTFLWKQGRIFLKAPITTGTASYVHTGGASERLVTFSASVLTDEMANWSVRIGGVPCRIEGILSSTRCTLEPTLNPGRDIPAGSPYRLYPAYYVLPNDFKRLAQPRADSSGWGLIERRYDEILALERDDDITGTPVCYCIRGIEDLYGSMGLWVYPASDSDGTLDFIYERRPREIRYTGYRAQEKAGTVSVSGQVVTGTGTAFEPDMVGSIIRISGSASTPTGWRGNNPYVVQRSIVSVTSATQLVLDSPVSNSLTGAGYTISDPVDIDPTLHQALLDCMVKRLAIMQEWKDAPLMLAMYQASVNTAKCANSSGGRRVMGAHSLGVVKKLYRYTGDTG